MKKQDSAIWKLARGNDVTAGDIMEKLQEVYGCKLTEGEVEACLDALEMTRCDCCDAWYGPDDYSDDSKHGGETCEECRAEMHDQEPF